MRVKVGGWRVYLIRLYPGIGRGNWGKWPNRLYFGSHMLYWTNKPWRGRVY